MKWYSQPSGKRGRGQMFSDEAIQFCLSIKCLSNRVGKIFIDYLRNGRGATTISAWAARARPGLGISVPLEWDELQTLKSSAQWTVANVHTRLDRGNEPWAGYARAAKGLTKAMKILGFDE